MANACVTKLLKIRRYLDLHKTNKTVEEIQCSHNTVFLKRVRKTLEVEIKNWLLYPEFIDFLPMQTKMNVTFDFSLFFRYDSGKYHFKAFGHSFDNQK